MIDIQVRQVDPVSWELLAPVLVDSAAGHYVVPAGYRTDFASVPRVAVWLIPRFGAYTAAAIVHDYLITDALPAGTIESRDVDHIFRSVMRDLGVPIARRWLMWAGVRWGALFNRRRRGGWLRTAPGVLAVSALALPVVLPGALGVLVSLALAWLLGLPFPRRERPTSWRT